MHLWIADRLERDPMYFREAHLWRFKRQVDTSSDVLAFKVGGVIPEYVREFTLIVQAKERENAVPPLQREHGGR